MAHLGCQIAINATQEQIFAAYIDVATWSLWDSEVASVDLPDGLTHGASGYLKPTSGPKASIIVSDFDPPTSFSVTSALPLCKMTFEHKLSPLDHGTKAYHGIVFSGPLAAVFRFLIGRKITKTLPDTLNGLKKHVEDQK